MKQTTKNYREKQTMAHPDFPELGLGNVAYISRTFDKNQFVYSLTAANGEILLDKEAMDVIQDFIFEHSLEVTTIQ